jgi:hypothetical protein
MLANQNGATNLNAADSTSSIINSKICDEEFVPELDPRASALLTQRNEQVAQLINEMRDKFLACVAKSPQDYDQMDIDRIKNNDFAIERYLIYWLYDAKEAFKQMDDSMKWRKSLNVNYLDFSNCPVEFFQTGGLFIFETDKAGRPVLYIRAKTYIKIPRLEKLNQVTT